jgi:hypothetical protein
MQLQRAWLELNLREISSAARKSPWGKLHALKLGLVGTKILKHRSLWIAGLTLLANIYRRRAARKEHT